MEDVEPTERGVTLGYELGETEIVGGWVGEELDRERHWAVRVPRERGYPTTA